MMSATVLDMLRRPTLAPLSRLRTGALSMAVALLPQLVQAQGTISGLGFGSPINGMSTRSAGTAGAFVEFDAAPGQRLNDKLLGTRHKARLIRVFNT